MNRSEMSRTRNLTITALMTAVLCILGPIVLPIGPVPISLTNLAIYLALYAVGTRRALVAYLVYLLLGIAGLPVFSAFEGGPQRLVGPAGGYLIGFILMLLVAGWFIDRDYQRKLPCILGMILGLTIAYALGTLWLSYAAGMPLKAAIMAGVAPFVLEDLAKIAFAAFLGTALRDRLIRAGLFPGKKHYPLTINQNL